MAYLALRAISPYDAWIEIAGLSQPFNQTYYSYAFIGDQRVIGGEFNGSILGAEDAPATGSSRSVSIYTDLSSFNPDGNRVITKTLYGVTSAASDNALYNAGSITVRIPSQASSSPGSFTLTVSAKDYYADLSWTRSSGAYYYEIYVDEVYVGATTNLYYTVDGLSDSTSYTFMVIAANDYGDRTVTKTARTTAPLPEQPIPDVATLIGANTAKVTFTKGYDAQYTELYWNTSGADPAFGSGYDVRTTNSSTIYVYNLPYNSEVFFWLRSRASSGSVSDWVYCDYITTGDPPPPSAPVIDSRFDGGLNMSWGSVTGASQYTFEYKPSYLTTWTAVTTSNTYCTISGLSYAVKYDFRVKSNLNPSYSTISNGHTLPKKPTISATNITHSSVTIRVEALPDNCDKVKIECYVYSNGNYVFHSMKFIDPTGRTFPTAQTTTFTGLDRGWPYRFFAVSAYDANGDGTGTGTWLESYPSNEVTVSTLNRPDNWEWVTNFYSGMEFTIYWSGSENYYYIMPATEWNSFLARINEFRVYKDLSEVSFPTYVKDNYFTYTVYNQAVSAINAMSAYFIGYTAIPTKSSGSELTAADFFRLRDTLNSID